MRVSRAGALAATSFAFGLAPTLAIGPHIQQTQQTETSPDTPNGRAPVPSRMFAPVPATSPPHPGCTPATNLLRFDGGYEVSMCYRTADGVDGQAKAGLYASAESGLLWFFSRDNAEVLVKVLNGCAINGHRWVFVAPVTTLEFDLWVTSPTGKRWTHGNTQGETAATKSDVAAFACADEPEAAADPIVSRVSVNEAKPAAGQNIAFHSTVLNVLNSGDRPATATNGREGSDSSASATSLRYHLSPDKAMGASDASIASDTVAAPTLAAGPQTETIPDTANGMTPLFVPVTSSTTPGCTPTTTLFRFDGGYEVSMCYRTPEGNTGQATAGLYASAESGLLWFFSRDNAEVLVKVLNGCAINGHRWIFVAPVTTLEFDLRVTSPTGERWTHGNTQGETAVTKSDVAAFACADEPDAAPDLIVSDVTVSDATPVAGQNITLRSTVRNRGDGAATPTTLRYYRSSDSTIDTSDDLLDSDAVPALAASATVATTLDFTVPSTPGTFYLGACIDSVAGESRTGNNCSTGVRVVVEDEPDEDPESAPDLTVSSVSVSDATPVADQNITLRIAVRNRGDGPATPTTLRCYRSSDATISRSDNVIASDAVPALAASATESTTLDFTVPSTPGTFYLGACIDSVLAESDTGNNCSAGVQVVVEDEPGEDPDEDPKAAPDLTVSGVSVNHENPVTDDIVTLQATVQNQGNAPASTTTLRLYRSDDSTINTEDDELGSEAVAELAAAATVSMTLDFTAPSTAGTFHLGVCIDSVSDESDTGNNCSDGVLVTVEEPEPAPDLTVSDFSVTDENPVTDDIVTLQATVQNQGDAPASTTTLRFYRSDDSTINTEDDDLGSEAVTELAASATVATTLDFTVPSTAGTFYLGACIDSVADESDTGNNCFDGVLVTVSDRPDLTVSDFTVSDENPHTDQTITLRAVVLNQGDGPAAETTLSFYQSDNKTISKWDTELGSEAVPALAALATETRTLSWDVPSTVGMFYLGACIRRLSNEADEPNNCTDGALVTVKKPPAPDLIVSDVSVSDENPAPGQRITWTAWVRNQGDVPASPTTLSFYRSENSTIDTSDLRLGWAHLQKIPVSTTVFMSINIVPFTNAGTAFFGACVESVPGESDTSNNCFDGVRVVVE